ncbi:CBO0543 family protein [Niallia sp. Krafla_26]|uniref:CBO0543 family protein n=1 Tax=Niallia sp. Krafla_26 TaxID=3064703 RepID=UPI003D16A0AB
MSRDKGILFFFLLLSFVLLLKLVPAHKSRQSIVMFLYKQLITWLFGTLVAEKGLIKYPVRLFKKAYKGSFSFEYFFTHLYVYYLTYIIQKIVVSS